MGSGIVDLLITENTYCSSFFVHWSVQPYNPTKGPTPAAEIIPYAIIFPTPIFTPTAIFHLHVSRTARNHLNLHSSLKNTRDYLSSLHITCSLTKASLDIWILFTRGFAAGECSVSPTSRKLQDTVIWDTHTKVMIWQTRSWRVVFQERPGCFRDTIVPVS